MSQLLKRYESLSLRERAFVMLALIAGLVLAWDSLFMQPLLRTRAELQSELEAAGQFGKAAQGADLSDPRQVNLHRAGQLQTQLAGLDSQLKNTASGFVSADRMIQVLHDVLDAQGSLELVSIRNLPVTSLVPPASTEPGQPMVDGAAQVAQAAQPPFVHAVEIVIDGQYNDILEYLAALEALPWKFRWTSFDLSTAGYPRNRVRIEIATLSLDSTWLGV
jgi:MSHA biogenesis protein MshJ